MPAFFSRHRRQQEPNPPPTDSGAAAPRTAFIDGLHVFVLATFAVTQPLYDRLGESPVFLEDSGFGIRGVLLLALVLSLGIPAVPALLTWAVGRFVPRARLSFRAIVVFLLAAILLLPVAKRADELLPAWCVIGLALTAAAVATWSYFAFRAVRSATTVAALGIAAFPAWFLWHTPVVNAIGTSRHPNFATAQPAPIVMIVLDELCGAELVNEQREIDGTRFPNFADLARGSTWYRNASTVHPETWLAVPAILTGKLPRTSFPPRARDLPQNLFNILGSTGEYDLAVFEPISRLAAHRLALARSTPRSAPAQVASVLPTLSRVFVQHLAPGDLQHRLPGVPPLWFGIGWETRIDRDARRGVFRYVWGDDRRGQFEHFTDCLDNAPRPALHFIHVLLPHVPWCYLPTGRRYLAESNRYELLSFTTYGGSLDLWGTDPLYVAQSQQRHLLQVQFTDAMLGRVLARLRETELYDRCLLIVTADHGISFKVNEERRVPTPGNLPDIMSVPLFIKLPGQQAGAVNDRTVESIDLLPTIVDVLKIQLPLPVDGVSVLDMTHPDRERRTIYKSRNESMTVPADILSGSTVAAELRSRLGSSDDPDALFKIGPHPGLLGRSPLDWPAGAVPPVEIELIRSETRYTEDRDDLVPCYFEGWVVSPFNHDKPVPIAVAVNGVIRAVTRTYQLDSVRDRWAALVPESALRLGENDVKYYSVTEDSNGLHLQECIIVPVGTREALMKRR